MLEAAPKEVDRPENYLFAHTVKKKKNKKTIKFLKEKTHHKPKADPQKPTEWRGPSLLLATATPRPSMSIYSKVCRF